MVGVDDAFTTGAAVSELEFGIVHARARRVFQVNGSTAASEAKHATAAVLTFTHGLTPRLDLTGSTFGVSYSDDLDRGERHSGVGDVFVEAKWRFRGGGSDGVQLAYKPGLSIPAGREDPASSQAPGLGFWLATQAFVATVVERRWAVGIETGFLLPIGDRQGVRGLGFGSIGAGYQATARVKPEIELTYEHEVFDRDADARVFAITAGLILNPSDSIRLDLGLRRGMWGENFDQRLTGSANVSFTFGGATLD